MLCEWVIWSLSTLHSLHGLLHCGWWAVEAASISSLFQWIRMRVRWIERVKWKRVIKLWVNQIFIVRNKYTWFVKPKIICFWDRTVYNDELWEDKRWRGLVVRRPTWSGNILGGEWLTVQKTTYKTCKIIQIIHISKVSEQRILRK
jgi:hypothetical protein